jgi:hypothetical protein
LIQLTVDADNKDDVAKAEAFMEAEDFDGLDEWIHEEVIEPLNTYSVDQHKLDVPTPFRQQTTASTSRAANSPACSTACASCRNNGSRRCTAALPSAFTTRWN